jgi:CheY-like chemotaxis protein
MWTTRVLVVDDTPLALRTMARLLNDKGFTVHTAASRQEAMEAVQRERFHVAILDMCLDELNDDNREGLELMNDILAVDPTTAIVILTGYADARSTKIALLQQPDRNPIFKLWTSPAYDFIEKQPENLKNMPSVIRRAFTDVIHVNPDLKIEYPEGYLDTVVGRLGFVETPRPDDAHLRGEVDELLRKLFYTWMHINIKPLPTSHSGNSKAVVFQVEPRGEMGQAETIIAKIGDPVLIAREIDNYRQFIRGWVSFVPTAIEPAWRTRSLGGIVYTYAGLGGNIRDFAQVHREQPEASQTAVRNLFQRTLNWRPQPDAGMCDRDMRRVHMRLLRLTAEELREKRDLLIQEGKLRRRGKKLIVVGADVPPLVDPVEFALSTKLEADCAEMVVHGDLHVHNVLVDSQDNSWLIDFANTNRGPIWFDYAFFEISSRVELVAGTPMEHYTWARLLSSVDALELPPLPPHLASNPDILNMHPVIDTVRQLAFGSRPTLDRLGYLHGLLFKALRLVTVRFLSAERRLHALIIASQVAERLGAGSLVR